MSGLRREYRAVNCDTEKSIAFHDAEDEMDSDAASLREVRARSVIEMDAPIGNPYANTPRWAQWYSEQLGWPVSLSVASATEDTVRCDLCGATTTFDSAIPGTTADGKPAWRADTRPMSLTSDYCFGCGLVWCQACQDRRTESKGEMWGEHTQEDHRP